MTSADAIRAIVKLLGDNDPCCSCCGGDGAYDQLRLEVQRLACTANVGLHWRIALRSMSPAAREIAVARGQNLAPPGWCFATIEQAEQLCAGNPWWKIVLDESEAS